MDHYTGAKVFYSNHGIFDLAASRKIIKHVKPDYIYFNSMYSPKFLIVPLILLHLSGFSGKVTSTCHRLHAFRWVDIRRDIYEQR